MTKTFSIIMLTIVLAISSVSVYAGVSLTVYNDNFAVVRENRQIGFEPGINKVNFTDVASAIDPTSVGFECLDGPDVRILEQNYEYDLVNSDSLLKRYIDKQVRIFLKGSGSKGGSLVIGNLSAYVGRDLIIENQDGTMAVISRDSVESISLEAAPDDLVTKPTLVWLAKSQTGGTKNCEVTYTTGAVNWKADYRVVLNGDDTELDFSGWVTIDNRSGASYRDAQLKLIAGDVRRVKEVTPRVYKGARGISMESMAIDESFAEKSFMEYHMYTLGRKSTVANNQTKQIEFIEPVNGVSAKKKYVYEVDRGYYGDSSRKGKVQIKIEFANDKSSGLGIALPKGKVRTFKTDPADGALEFVGEDTIDHTASKEDISLYIGNAFDLVVEDVLIDVKSGRSWGDSRSSTREVVLKNRKDEDVVIDVMQYLNKYHNWNIDEVKLDGKKH